MVDPFDLEDVGPVDGADIPLTEEDADLTAPPSPDYEPDMVLTFLPSTPSAKDSPLEQYLPFRLLPPEERSCGAFLFDQLTEKQAIFLMTYLETGSLAQASTRSGLPRSTYHHDKLRPLLVLIKKADQANMAKRTGLTRQRWLEELQNIALLDPSTMYDEEGKLRKLHEMPRSTRAAMQVTERETGNTRMKNMAPHEKLPALRMLGEAMHFLEDFHKPPPQRSVELIFVEADPKKAREAEDSPQEPLTNVTNSPQHSTGPLSGEIIYPF